jgi:hypothetical protein
MAKKAYSVIAITRTALPRSKRLRELGTSGTVSGGSSVVVKGSGTGDVTATGGDGHTHANKSLLDSLSADSDRYLYISQYDSINDETTVEKVKAGYADVAHDLDEESPIMNKFLRKDIEDAAAEEITFDKGLKVGTYVNGMVGGSGGKIDGDGRAELTSLTLREFLEVPELRFNRIDVVSGELWNSIAFGTIESVDTENCIASLKLEEGERSGLHQNDICRGIFSNFGNGTQSTDVDGCGFEQLYGFSTSYFTPTEILTNKDGVFRFRYALKAGTSVHPCVAMKFAVYGNFTDASRRASAYQTRTYTRYLANVSTWVIDPDTNIYAQYGSLDGLQIGSVKMTGYGSFQSNAYFKGVQIQLRSDQLADLKGESAYSVSLTGEEGLVTVDDEGNIVGGTQALYNVTSAEANVVSGKYNVVALGYRLQTRVQAFKGAEELEFSTEYGGGKFEVGLMCVGCSASMVGGVLTVLTITNPDKCWVELTVNCEGCAVFTKEYRITAVRNGTSPLTADIDNEMAAVACNSDGKVLFGLPVSTRISVWHGTSQLDIDELTLTLPEGVTATADRKPEEGSQSGKVEVTEITDTAESVLPIAIVAKATYAGVQYAMNLQFCVTKQVCGENAVIYQLAPNVSSVKVDEEGNYSDKALQVAITLTDGKTSSVPESLPAGLRMTYQVYDAEKDKYGDEQAYTYNTAVGLSGQKLTNNIKFFLYQNDVLIDQECIPILEDGKSVIIADFDNEMDAVACDESGTVLDGYLPVSTNFTISAGGQQLELISLSVGNVTGVTATADKTTGKVEVTAITKEAARTLRIPITGQVEFGNAIYNKTLYFVVNKVVAGENAVICQLRPSVSVIKIDKNGNYSPTSVSCKLRVTNGSRTCDFTSLPAGYSMKVSQDGGSETSYTINTDYALKTASSAVSSNVTFYLYSGTTLVDKETLPLVVDGTDGTDGTSPTQYELVPSNLPLRISVTGSISPAKFAVYLYGITGNERVAKTPTSWKVEGSTDGDTWKTYASDNYSTSGNTLTVTNISQSYTFYRITATIDGRDIFAYATIGGQEGVGISSVTEYYAKSNSGTSAPADSSFSTTIPTIDDSNPYLWNYESIAYTDGTSKKTDKHMIGYKGKNGSDGDTGNGISSIKEHYLATSSSSGVTTKTSGWTETVQTISESSPYLWNYSTVTFTNGGTSDSTPVIIGHFGKDGGKGDKGDKGDRGSMPRYRKAWATKGSSDAYVYDSNYCDIVVHNGKAYKVAVYGTSCTTEEPGKDSKWEEANTFSFVAMDTALIDGASIAGFTFKDNKMQSADGESLILDGVNGEITAKKGTFSGTLNAVSGSFSKLTCKNGDTEVGSISFNTSGYITISATEQVYINKAKIDLANIKVGIHDYFGSRYRTVGLVVGNSMTVYSGLTSTKVTLQKSTSLTENDTYVVGASQTINGIDVPLDIIIFKNTSSYYYVLSMYTTQRVLLMNTNDKNTQYIYQNKSAVKLEGGNVREAIQLSSVYSSMSSVNSLYGGHLLFGGNYNNDA